MWGSQTGEEKGNGEQGGLSLLQAKDKQFTWSEFRVPLQTEQNGYRKHLQETEGSENTSIAYDNNAILISANIHFNLFGL